MLKLNSLKALLTQCLPDLARDPNRLIVLAENGTVVSTGTTSLSFEWRYTARVIVLDYDGHADAVIVPIIAWMKRNQSEQMDNPELWGNAIKFRVEPLTPTTMDFGIELQLTERAIVKPDPTAPPDAPPPPGGGTPRRALPHRHGVQARALGTVAARRTDAGRVGSDTATRQGLV